MGCVRHLAVEAVFASAGRVGPESAPLGAGTRVVLLLGPHVREA